MYTEIESKNSIEDIEKLFPVVAAEHNFGIMGVHDLRRNLIQKGVDFNEECLVYEICSPLRAKAVLSHNLAIASVLPCRVAVYRKHDKTILSTVNPTSLLGQFSFPQLGDQARDLEKEIFDILHEVAHRSPLAVSS